MAKSPTAELDEPRRQIAALPWRIVDGRLEVCLVTTRETHRWTIPKGWPIKRLTARAAARTEAEEEAGVTGKVGKTPIGAFTYWKRMSDRFHFVRVEVYALKVERHLATFKESAERDVRWMTPDDAALLVEEPDLAGLLARFAPERG
ncbi:NUDIX hydrolase [Pinisolibacter aquiterrae]|uniref:NUDIX hydrolase n=1 Tax=Pinisolibacter aquiterrae TaxID=2815579 RepID=UPI001C3CFDF1|nr:NUDIX hydrolase [Pinisolibacter aquiterrae]MBV5265097.1 NUDIX hydrolase [Pinisolibacter aquiterrae]MCC8235573.1 NUDIX hydrolase [Pinisolibacter aquiterrae]